VISLVWVKDDVTVDVVTGVEVESSGEYVIVAQVAETTTAGGDVGSE
jgi:hypothetical protein